MKAIFVIEIPNWNPCKEDGEREFRISEAVITERKETLYKDKFIGLLEG